MGYSTATEQVKEEKQEIKAFRLATVTALFEDGCPKIRFMGEETDSEKKYKIIDDGSYVIGDTVLIGVVNDGYVILGAVGYSPNNGGGEVTVYLTEEQANSLYATLGHTHTGYATSSHTHDELQTASGSISVTFMTFAGSPNTYALYPSSDGSCDLGRSSYKYKTIYATTSTISTSDENKKKDIEPLDKRYEALFMLLKPKRYKFIDGESGRYHTGFISQEVEQAMNEVGLTDLELAAFIKSPRQDDEGNSIDGFDYGLRYEEIESLNTMMIQKLFGIIEMQNTRIEALERGLINGQNISN